MKNCKVTKKIIKTQTIKKVLFNKDQQRQQQELINWISIINNIQMVKNLSEFKHRANLNFDDDFKKITTKALKRRLRTYITELH